MDRKTIFTIVGFIILGAIMLRQTVASIVNSALPHPNVIAFRAMIYRLESGGDYNILYGGGHFQDDSAHPDIKVPFINPNRAPHPDGSANDFSTAAGAGQINYPTWLLIQAVAMLPDFSPQSQDTAMVYLFQMRGILPNIIAGDFMGALSKASGTWASLPGSRAGQHPRAYQTALNTYVNFGGQQT